MNYEESYRSKVEDLRSYFQLTIFDLRLSTFNPRGIMDSKFLNPDILERFDELIRDGNALYQDTASNGGTIRETATYTQWATSCLNLFDKLSSSTNRFVNEFEYYGRMILNNQRLVVNVGTALGVLVSAKEEYLRGLAIDYHLSVSSAVFNGLLEESRYLFSKNYLRAAAVLAGAALEEGLKTRTRSEGVEFSNKDGLSDIVVKLKRADVGVLTEFEAKKIEPIGKIRNDAAHGGEFNYHKQDVQEMIDEVEKILTRILGGR